MWISSLKLGDFRGYTKAELEFSPGFNLIWGNNGLGKTNIVEAIYFSTTFESHRTAATTHLIRDGASEASITASLRASGRSVNQTTALSKPSQTRVWVNGSPKRKLSDALGTTSSVIFSPEDLDTIRRDPSDRRRFIDQVVIQLQPRLAGVRADYERVLKQRNTLLKSLRAAGRRAINISAEEARSLEIWDEQLVRFGTELTIARISAISQLKPGFQHFYGQISGDSGEANIDPWLAALSKSDEEPGGKPTHPKDLEAPNYSLAFSNRLQELRTEELERGVTLIGPHRDDILFQLNGLPARFDSSQGEAWSLALGAKLAIAALLADILPSGSPILLLDDVFSVLDPDRRGRLLAHLTDYEQVIITATSKDGLPKMKWSNSIRLTQGDGIPTAQQNAKFEIEAL